MLPDSLGSTGPAFAAMATVALMLAVVVYDLVTRRRPHVATVVGLLGIWVLGSAISSALIGSGMWRAFVRLVS